MIDSLFDKSTQKSYDSIARKQAELDEKKRYLAKTSKEKLTSKTIMHILDVGEEYGHPNEQKLCIEIRKKYVSGKELDFEDYMNLSDLYKSNYASFTNKDIKHE